MKSVDIVYRPGNYKANADALPRSTQGVAPRDQTVEEVQVGQVDSVDAKSERGGPLSSKPTTPDLETQI